MFVCILSVLIKVEVSISTLLYVFPLYYLIIFIATSEKVLTSNGSIQNYWSREPTAKNINVGKYRTNIFNEKCRERWRKKTMGYADHDDDDDADEVKDEEKLFSVTRKLKRYMWISRAWNVQVYSKCAAKVMNDKITQHQTFHIRWNYLYTPNDCSMVD